MLTATTLVGTSPTIIVRGLTRDAVPEPEWVSINLGVFLCTACVSIHRSLGVNVSSIRSITLDRWDRSMLKGIQQIGNARSNAIYEKHLMAGAKPTASSSSEDRRRFIVAKYVEKAFTKGEDASASLAGKEVASEVAANEHALPSPPPPTPIRLVDYFAVVGRGDLKQLAGYGMLDSTFDSVVTDRYPLSDHVDLEFPGDAIAQFCFPQDAELASSEMTPRRLAFCLTSATGVRQYVVALMFWELLKPMEVVALEAQCSNYQGNVANRDVCGKHHEHEHHRRRPSLTYDAARRRTKRVGPPWQPHEAGGVLAQVYRAHLTLAVRQRLQPVSLRAVPHQPFAESTSRSAIAAILVLCFVHCYVQWSGT